MERINAEVGGQYDPADMFGFRWEGGYFIADTRLDTRYPFPDYYGSDTTLTLFDKFGNVIASNDNWFDGVVYARIEMELPETNYYIGVSRGGEVIDNISDYMNIGSNGTYYPYLLNMTQSRNGVVTTRSIVSDPIPIVTGPTLVSIPSTLYLILLGVSIIFCRKYIHNK